MKAIFMAEKEREKEERNNFIFFTYMGFLIECPHCKQICEIIALNCCIFRCGVYKHNNNQGQAFEQIPPHLPKSQCDELVQKGLIYGCGKPFRIIVQGEKKEVVVCDYI
jgi:hypothetical protein